MTLKEWVQNKLVVIPLFLGAVFCLLIEKVGDFLEDEIE